MCFISGMDELPHFYVLQERFTVQLKVLDYCVTGKNIYMEKAFL